MKDAEAGGTVSLFQFPRTRGYFEDGLRQAFPPNYDPPPVEMRELVRQLRDKIDAPRED
jgi:hypothetical protein